MKKYWKPIMIVCILVFVGLHLYDFYYQVKKEVVDVVGEEYFYDEEKAEPVYVDSYIFDGEEIKFYFDNKYGLRGSYIIKDGKEIYLFERTDFKSKDLSTIFHIQEMNVDKYEVYENGVYEEPAKIIDNGQTKVKVYEFDADAYVTFTPPGNEGYSVVQCKDNQRFCDLEMSMDLEALQEKIDSWERILNINELPHYKELESQFYVRSNFYVYEYLHSINYRNYSFSTAVHEDGSGFVEISGNTATSFNPTYRLTKEQMNEFMEFIESAIVK